VSVAQTHTHVHGHGHASQGRLAAALVLTTVVLLAELAGAWWSGSLALLSDAAHMSTDAVALGIALLADRAGRRPPDEHRTFGYRRIEVLAAVLNALLLICAAAFVLWQAWKRLNEPAAIASGVMLWVAGVGLVANFAGMRLLTSGQAANMNVRGAYLEVWSDMLGSLGVIAGAIAIHFTGWSWIDSAVAIAIGLWVVPRTIALLRAGVHVLLEGVPSGVELQEVLGELAALSGVREVHDLHVWSIGSGEVFL
jgi:cobalt-zinc-cadmium efflux system protein